MCVMLKSDLRHFVFTYSYQGNKFYFSVFSNSEDEAKERVSLMSAASFLGEFEEAEELISSSASGRASKSSP